MQIRKLSLLAGFFMFLVGCQENPVFSEYESFSNGWSTSDTLTFDFEAPDTIRPYDLFFVTRVNQDYAFNNLYLIATISFPNGKQIGDTLEYEMAYPDGELMGTGFGSVKESKLWYKSNVIFNEQGDYSIEVKHAMRKFGKIEALDTLQGIMDFGIHLETIKQAGN
ncbi:gliding motility lipoprotein GldH [Psychroflexus sp. CAK57W]|uniref:gliding motility lipoprotein GldH n=1 Tax=Psychroflexus curvus TaxID=2873595 RepID=UPI001CCDBD73|nr:gliding motility lipoprotein GldH [Psychroflexus curvus]MBZ9626952.1 gliding motility lipoprotein GldH [Psychroflexus curvus]MBZ9786945.1 gliding motility lipoprotein GldH [Psychroflexus curvus]